MILMNRSIVLAQILSNGIMKENFDYNYLGIEALMACYNECDYYVDQQNEYFWKNIGVVRDFLAENMPEVKMIEPEGTYLLWLDFRALEMTEKERENLIVNQAKLWLDSGAIFGSDGEGFERINIACPRTTLKEAFDRLAKALKSLG